MNITTTSPLCIIDNFFAEFITAASANWHQPSVMREVAFEQLMDELFFGNDEYRLHVEECLDGIAWDGMVIPEALIYERFEIKMAEICQISWADLKRAERTGYDAYIKWIARRNPDILRGHLEGMKEIGGDDYVIAMERVLQALIG
jgi:hypothetical protein